MIPQYVFLLITTILFHIPLVSAQTRCTGFNEWWDGARCFSCTRAPCPIGTYRETCGSSHIRDAICIPCSLPPPNSVHVTGGLPYTEDNCMWACREGYYRLGDGCEACSIEECHGSPHMMREYCNKGSTKDARCVCEKNFYLAEDPTDPEHGAPMCVPCSVTECENPALETFVGCPGNTKVDVSRCVATVTQGY